MKTIQIQVAFTLDAAAAQALAELLVPVIREAVGPAADEAQDGASARLRASQHALFGGEKPPEDQGLLIDSKQAARLLKVSPRTLWQMQSTGRMPAPVRIGRAVRWSLDVLKRWVEAGCPEQPRMAKP